MFGERLKYLRNLHKLTQSELATILKLSKANVSKYENSNLEPNIETLNMLSSYFCVSTDYLLGRTDEQNEIRPSNELDERINNLAKENSNIYKLIDFFSQLDPSKQQTLIDLAEAYIAKQNQDKKQ